MDTRRGTINPTLRYKIMLLRAENSRRPLSIDAILARLREGAYPAPPGRNTVARIVRAWEALSDEEKLLDRPWEWARTEEVGLPWEAAGFILACLRAWLEYEERVWGVSHTARYRQMIGRIPVAITNRMAKWAWRIHLAVSDLEPLDVLSEAVTVTTLDAMQEYFGEPLDLGYLSDWLVFRPWESGTSMHAYVRAVQEGHARPRPAAEQELEYLMFLTEGWEPLRQMLEDYRQLKAKVGEEEQARRREQAVFLDALPLTQRLELLERIIKEQGGLEWEVRNAVAQGEVGEERTKEGEE